jgi:hypothetical protein
MGGRPLGVDMIELVDKAPPTEWGGGTEEAPPNAMLRAFCFINMAARTLVFASQLLAVGQGLRGEEPLGLMPTLLVDSDHVLTILDGFTPASVLLRLDPPLIRRHVLRQLPRLGLLLRPTTGGNHNGGTSGEFHHFRFRCRRSNFGQGFLEGEEWLLCYWREGRPR